MARMKCLIGIVVLLSVSVLSEESEEQSAHRDLEEESRVKRGANAVTLWPKQADGLVYVPYIFSTFSPVLMVRFFEATAQFHSSTCIRFKTRNLFEMDFIDIIESNSCSSSLGRLGGRQNVSLGCVSSSSSSSDCGGLGASQRELLHTVGLSYEIQRPDRDQNIQILWNNILSEKLHLFQKMDPPDSRSVSFPYDYTSVMHFSSTAFSKSGQRTLEATHGTAQLGSDHMTVADIRRVNQVYCPEWQT